MLVSQKNINAVCKSAYAISEHFRLNENALYTEELHASKAIVHAYETKFGKIFILCVYDTIDVAAVDEHGNKYDFLRYSYGNSYKISRYISKFFENYGDRNGVKYTYKPI